MDTYFASPERAGPEELASEIEIISSNPIMTGLLNSVSGLLAVLNEHRQIVALNDAFLKMLGIEDPKTALGLRHGVVLDCIHAEEEPDGCGTTKFCSSCGAAIAVVSSLEADQPVERICALTARREGRRVDIVLNVKSHPVRINQKVFLLIFLQDITRQQHMAALERTFFHDINNMLSMLLMATELLVEQSPSDLADHIHEASGRLHKEIAIQRVLSQSEAGTYQPARRSVPVRRLLANLKMFFSRHPVARNKTVSIQQVDDDIVLNTDYSLTLRVICNMVINALEATSDNGEVRIWTESGKEAFVFCVWNEQEIAPEIVHRVFQRNFSTKAQSGRGIGTFSMKLFGEDILGGRVDFATSRQEGTLFRFSHPA